MLNFLPHFIIGIIALTLYVINIIVFPILVLVFGIIFKFTPVASWRNAGRKFINECLVVTWIRINNFIILLTTPTRWDISGTGTLRKNDKYLLICNHQSWVDILILQKVFGTKIPLLTFFMKKQLLWMLPFAGWACWAMEFPFMQRPSKSYLKKHPEKKGYDIEAMKHFCQRFKHQPITVISFIESTRFTTEKKHRQHSPYKHLLKPRASTPSVVLASMGDVLKHIINVTIIYPDGKKGLWDFVSGKVKKIIVRYEILPIDPNICGDYENDREFRVRFQNWLNQLWQKKDDLLDKQGV
jgi:1-acyl-sn-glycerol-3-phosphate acyltransferase